MQMPTNFIYQRRDATFRDLSIHNLENVYIIIHRNIILVINRLVVDWRSTSISIHCRDLRDKTMDDKFMYIQNYDKLNHLLCM